jgi:hypothetical protein
MMKRSGGYLPSLVLRQFIQFTAKNPSFEKEGTKVIFIWHFKKMLL